MSILCPTGMIQGYLLRFTLILLFIVPFLLQAEAISLGQAVSKALAENKSLTAAYFDLEKARGRILQSGLKPNPELELAANTDAAFSNEGERNLTLGVVQPIPLARRLQKAVAATKVELALSLADIRNRERLLIGEVQRIYVEILGLQEQITLRDRLLQVGQEFTEISERRLQAAEVSTIDLNAVQIEQDRLSLEQQLLAVEKTQLELELRQLIGMQPGAVLSLTGKLQEIAAQLARRLPPEASAVQRPDLRGFEFAMALTEAEIRLAKAEAWGDVNVGLEFESERSVFERPIGTESDRFFGFTVSIPLPIRNRNQGRIREQHALRAQTHQEILALELETTREITQASALAEKYQSLAKDYSSKVLVLSEQSLDSIKQAYDQGLIPVSQVVQTRQQALSFETAYLEVLTNYTHALINLETAAASSPYLKKDYLSSLTELTATLEESDDPNNP